MNRTIYDAAFHILSTQNDCCNKLEYMGLRFEYGDGFIGEKLLSLLNDAQEIIKETLGLHEVSRDAKVYIGGDYWPTTIEVLYTENEDPDWAMTTDDFYEFFYQAQKNETVKDLMWKAMVEKDVEAKEEYNKMEHGRIGYVFIE